LNQKFWNGKRVLVSGHTGFKGAWLAFWLSRLGARVTGVALPPATQPNLFDLLQLDARVRSCFVDVTDLDSFREVAVRADPEIFFHMAAQAQVREGYLSPVNTFQTNVLGVVHALEIARNLPSARAVVVVTSDKCYRNDGPSEPFREDAPLGGNDPYASSKACAELVTHSYRVSYPRADCRVATARAGNVIGGGDWSSDRLVPDIVRAIVSGAPLRIRNPSATRPWQHVLEPLTGYLMLAESLHRDGAAFAQAWNFGPDSDGGLSVSSLAESIFAAWGQKPRWQEDEASRQPEAQWLTVDASKARERLDWKTHLAKDDAIAWTVEWYKAWHLGARLQEVTAGQIDRYESMLRSDEAGPS
jgi:CDP-glucose 4,6-dehydratase